MRFLAQYPNDKALNDAALRRFVVAELVQNFAGMDSAAVFDAVGAAIRECAFRPSIADIRGHLHKARDKVRTTGGWCSERAKTCNKHWGECCGAPLTSEQVANRAAFMAKMREVYPSVFAKGKNDLKWLENELPRPAQSDVSPQLRELMAKRIG